MLSVHDSHSIAQFSEGLVGGLVVPVGRIPRDGAVEHHLVFPGPPAGRDVRVRAVGGRPFCVCVFVLCFFLLFQSSMVGSLTADTVFHWLKD